MSEFALDCVDVSKKFKKGESFDSLRDLIPAIFGRSLRKKTEGELDKGEFWALRNLSFQVKRGEALGIIGHNGAGKSTLLKLLSRIMNPTSGWIAINGKLSALIEIGAGFHDDLTGRENIFLNGVILGMSRAEITRKFDEIVHFSGLEEFIDTPVKRYSTGMHARLGFSVAAHVDPEILLVDEVLSVGDWAFQSKSAQKLEQLIKGGATVLFVSHNLKAIGKLCAKCILLEHGKAVKTGSTGEVISSYLDSNSNQSSDEQRSKIRISRVAVTRVTSDDSHIHAGEKIHVKVGVRSDIRCGDLAVHIYIYDSKFQNVFQTSTALLESDEVLLGEGDEIEYCVELTMHLGMGLYYLGAVARSKLHETSEQYDRRFPAATLYVDAPASTNGPANLYPSLVRVTRRAA